MSSSSVATSSRRSRRASSAREHVPRSPAELSTGAWRVLVGVGLALVFALSVVLTINGGLRWDDFGNLRYTQETDVLTFLLNPVFDHFAPGHRALTLLQYSLGPSDTHLMHLVMSGIQTIALAGFVGAARRLYGRRPWIVPLVLLVSVSTTFVSTQLWFAASLHQIPALAAALWSVAFFLRYRETHAGRDLLVSVVLVVLGLTFISKVLLAVGVIYLVDQLLLRPVRLSEVRTRTVEEWPLWLAYVLPVAVYLLFVSDVLGGRGEVSSTGSILTGIRDGWLERFVPLLIGWDPTAMGEHGATRLALVMGLQALLAVAVYVGVRRRRDTSRVVAIVLAVIVVNGVMTMMMRIDSFGPQVPMIYRYWLEPFVYAALLLPWGFVRPADDDAPRWLRRPPRLLRAAFSGTLVLVAIGALSAWSAEGMVDDHSAFDAKRWLEDVQAAVDEAQGQPSIVDDVAPIAWAPVWTLRDMNYLFPDARFTDDPEALMVAGDRLIEPDYQPQFTLTGAEFLTNTLTKIEGEVVADGEALCAADDASLEVVLAPSEVRRFSRTKIRGEGEVVFVPRNQAAEDLPARALYDGTTEADVFFPMDLWPLATFQLRLTPAPDGDGLCLESLSVGTISNAADIPGNAGP